jgi:hypothetical protein
MHEASAALCCADNGVAVFGDLIDERWCDASCGVVVDAGLIEGPDRSVIPPIDDPVVEVR